MYKKGEEIQKIEPEKQQTKNKTKCKGGSSCAYPGKC